MIIKTHNISVYYDTQLEFAEHLKQMLDAGYRLCGIQFKKKDKEHFHANYVLEEVENIGG